MKRTVLPAPPADELVIVRNALVPKLSARSAGSKIGYKLGYPHDQSEVFLSLTENQGGGYFSREWVPLARIIDKLKSLAGDGPFPAITLKSVMVGKSVNNASFLAAALVAEGVLKPEEDRAFKLGIVGDPAQWRTSLFSLSGEVENLLPPETPNMSENTGATQSTDTDSSETDAPKKNNRGARLKGLLLPQEAENEDHPQPE